MNPDGKATTQEKVESGAGFRLETRKLWSSPSADQEGATASISIFIANRSSRPLHFNRFDTVRLALSTLSGDEILFDGGRDATRPAPVVSPLLPPGATHEISFPARLVEWKGGEGWRLIGSEDFGGLWYFDGLLPGEYLLRAIYENEKSKIGEKDSVWTGRAVTYPLEIEVR